MLSFGDFDTEAEFLEYHAARSIWKRRDELTPSALARKADGPTWGQWFRERFKRSLEDARADFLARMEQGG